jgi:hypothetical protein
LLPSIQDEPNRPSHPRFAIPQPRRLYRWHPDQGHFSLVREDDDDWEEYADNLCTYDAERLLFNALPSSTNMMQTGTISSASPSR